MQNYAGPNVANSTISQVIEVKSEKYHTVHLYIWFDFCMLHIWWRLWRNEVIYMTNIYFFGAFIWAHLCRPSYQLLCTGANNAFIYNLHSSAESTHCTSSLKKRNTKIQFTIYSTINVFYCSGFSYGYRNQLHSSSALINFSSLIIVLH